MYWESQKVQEHLYIERFYSFFEEWCDPTFRFGGESHPFWECLYVQEGEICASADDRVYDLSAGEIIIHKPFAFHKFHVKSEAGANVLIFSFSLEGSFSDYLRNKIIRLSEGESQILQMLLAYAKTHKNPNGRVPGDFLDYDDRFPEYMQTVRSYIYLLLLSLTSSTASVSTVKAFDSEVYQKAIQYMTGHIDRNVSISEIAAYCNVGTTFLKQTFGKYSGMSVHKFALNLKMRNAVELLKNGHTVTETAMLLGFCSQPYFSAAFRRELGYSPTDVQKQMKRLPEEPGDR